jgi:hypothetical protein
MLTPSNIMRGLQIRREKMGFFSPLANLLGFPLSHFTKPNREAQNKITPKKKGKNPEPGFVNVPIFNLRELIQYTIEKNIKNRYANPLISRFFNFTSWNPHL